MGGFFGVASKTDCVTDLFFGTDYHSHLGTRRGGLVVKNGADYTRFIHDITNAQFRSKFDHDIGRMKGNIGLGVISDYEDQPLLIGSHLGLYSIVTVGIVTNATELAKEASDKQGVHFSEMTGGELNQTELVAALINQGSDFLDGIRIAQEKIEGSCSILVLTDNGIYAARDRLGRTPIMIGERDGAYAATMETCALPNLDYRHSRTLGPAEVVRLTPDGVEQLQAPGDDMQICSFLWVYYGYPASSYEGINVEATRNRCGAALARADDIEADLAAGIPDSGTAHAIGYANEAGIPYRRPFVKYTPTWPRSFMPQDQTVRDLVARMKLIPIEELITGQRMVFCEDSIVRGTQLQDTVQRLYASGAREVHMRPACPPLVFGCKYLNFSRSKSVMDLAGRRAVKELEGTADCVPEDYYNADSDKYAAMVERIRLRLNLTTLKYQKLDDLVEAIGMPKSKLCTYCWDGCTGCKCPCE
ncbi:MAG: amidophosphoribosyltransferase [Lentisphaerae bacterium]|jgi:amidophosphoribosyltransferase|nr:amidophosphoribosyltransferase [Lentisphaerota bacterium]MBT5605006.1 amidophosphoribosyltransferase [Lentisphaerota bacterium]MBT7054636.1 amidophosphoribosyltransferase [Lentisphaerota bacterium]MBT7844665.1 amidophosphoribosyltransferase [Lentisphaerota bacterium]